MRERALIVGCGRIAGGYNEQDRSQVLTHVAAYRHLGIDVAGCCDADPERARAFAKTWDIPASGADLDRMLADIKPTIVSDCTPPQARLSIVERAAAAPSVRSLVVEKPLACTGRDARAAAEAIERHGRRAVVNYFRAFDPFYRGLADDARQHAGDPLVFASAMYYGPAFTNASHLLERLIDMMGAPVDVTRLSGSDTAPAFSVRFDSGASALFMPAPATSYTPLELDLMFDKRRVRVIDSERRAEQFTLAPDPLFPEYSMLTPAGPLAGTAPSLDAFTKVFQAALDGGDAAAGTLMRAVQVTEWLERAGATLP